MTRLKTAAIVYEGEEGDTTLYDGEDGDRRAGGTCTMWSWHVVISVPS